jgi:hypothetical protein
MDKMAMLLFGEFVVQNNKILKNRMFCSETENVGVFLIWRFFFIRQIHQINMIANIC